VCEAGTRGTVTAMSCQQYHCTLVPLWEPPEVSHSWQAVKKPLVNSVFQTGLQSRRNFEGVCRPIEKLQQRVRASLKDPKGES